MTRLNTKLLASASVLAITALMSQTAHAADLATSVTADVAADDNTTGGGSVTITDSTDDTNNITVTDGGGGTAVVSLNTANSDLTLTGTDANDLAEINVTTGGVEAVRAGADVSEVDINVNAFGLITTAVAGDAVVDLEGSINSITLAANGSITSTANNVTTILVAANEGLVDGITNAGTIDAHGTGDGIQFAGASTTSVTNSGTISSDTGNAIDLDGALTGTITNQAAGTLSAAGGIAVDLNGDVTGGLINAGTISETSGTAVATNVDFTTITNSGTITATSGKGLDVTANTLTTLTNSGTITDTTDGEGIDVGGTITTLTNTGTISAGTSGTGLVINGTVTTLNNTGGTISTATGKALQVANAYTGSITNTGTITASSTGIALDIDQDITGTITNTGGTISSNDGVTVDIEANVSGGLVNQTAGTISSTGNLVTIDIADGAELDITNTASTITAAGSAATINYAGTTDGGITNTGSITNTGTGSAILVANNGELNGASGIITNSGTISAAGADAIDLDNIDGTITNSGTISAAGNFAAIEIQDAVGGANITSSNIINNQSGGTITASGTADTVNLVAGAGVDMTITNAGTISNTGAGAVIDLTGDETDTEVITVSNSGSITASAATNAAVKLGDVGVLTNTGTITGTVSGVASSNETINWNGGTITGAIDLGADAGDTINVGDSSSDSISTGGAIDNVGALNINQGTFSVGHTLTMDGGAETITTDANATLSITDDITVNSRDIDVNGTLKVADNKTLTTTSGGTTDIDIGSGGNIRIVVGAAGSTFGQIDAETTDTGQIDFAADSSIVLESAGFIANGTKLGDVIKSDDINFDGSNLSSSSSLTLTSTSPLVTYSIDSTTDATELDLVASTSNANTVTTNSNNSAVATAVSAIGLTGDADLDTVVNQVYSLTTNAAIDAAVATLTPDVSGITSGAVADATAGAQGTVSTRVASLRGNSAGIATGADFRDTALWGEFFGGSADQDDRDNVRGYQADIVGGTIGIDAEVANNLTVGFAGSYSQTDADSARGSAEADTFQGTLYGTYTENGNWYDGQLAVGFSGYETTRNINVGSVSDVARADYDGINYAAKFEVGRDIKVQGPLQFTPRTGFEYTLITQDSYTETGSSADLTVDNDDIQKLDLGVGFDLSYPLVANGVSYLPELRFDYKYDVIGDEVEATSKFTSASTTFKSEGADVAESTFIFGAGLDILAQDNLTVSFDYDATQREDFQSHTGSVKARFAF